MSSLLLETGIQTGLSSIGGNVVVSHVQVQSLGNDRAGGDSSVRSVHVLVLAVTFK